MHVRSLVLAAAVTALYASAQQHLKPIRPNDPAMPQWAQLMYAPDPDVNAVVDAYEAYHREHTFEKTVHTQYYKFWVNAVRAKVGDDGHVDELSPAQRKDLEKQVRQRQGAAKGGGGWTYVGPDKHWDEGGAGVEVAKHCNVYTIDRSVSDPNILFCGTESGGVYRSLDQAQSWQHVSQDHLVGAVSAIRIHPVDPDIVLFSAENELWRSTDGGDTWAVIGDPAFQALNISAWELAFDPSDPNTVLAACNLGMYRSLDLGDTWSEVLPNECMTIAHKPNDPATVYTIQFEPALNLSRFYKSTDHGLTWTMYDAGWFAPPPGETGLYQIEGGRLAVTAADPDRIYAVLVGYQQPGASITTNGWVGTWVSTDGGTSWTHPHNQVGTPYSSSHPNLMNFSGDDGDYTQIHYNTCIIASQIDPDRVLIGGLNLWRSNDGCATYQPVGGYIGPVARTHPDMQELRVFPDGNGGEEVWIGCDGGVYRSTDLVASHEARCNGLRAINLWGFDQGWNDDVMVGGRYHNGNMGYHEDYPANEYFALGGGEAPTGYVNYSDERKTYFSDIGGKVLPADFLTDPPSFGMQDSPNESYGFCSSSRIAFDHRYYNVAWMGLDNVLYGSTNGGGSFSPFHAFGSNAGNKVLWLEQSYADPDVMVVQQVQGNTSRLWRTTDGGANWTQLTLPGTQRNLFFSLGGANAGEIWLGYTNRPNGQKVYKSTDGGATWQNITTAMLDGEEVWGVAHQFGTDGGVYVGLKNGRVLYRNNSMPDWDEYSAGLPVSTEPIRIVPFYKGGKIRLATWNLGVWEQDLYEPSALIADFAAAFGTFFCPGDSVHFVDHSVCGAGASYAWSFPGATPSTSADKYPSVVYGAPGTYDVTLTVTDNGVSQTVTRQAYISSTTPGLLPLAEDFEAAMFPDGWTCAHANGGSSCWGITPDASGYGQGQYSMVFDNFNIDVQGARDEQWLGKLDLSQAQLDLLQFDVAYAPYGGQYSDTLAVLASTDCGASWTELYVQGGGALATAPGQSSYFIPGAAQWRTDLVDVADLSGEPEVIIAFQNRGRWGNVIYVDNINLVDPSGIAGLDEGAELTVWPNPAGSTVTVQLDRANGTPADLRLLDALGRTVLARRTAGGRTEIDVTALAPGAYTVLLTGPGMRLTRPLQVVR
jgi:PKD repeat protein